MVPENSDKNLWYSRLIILKLAVKVILWTQVQLKIYSKSDIWSTANP